MVFGRYPNLKHLPNHFWSELRWLCKWAIRLYFGTLFLAVAVTQVRLPASARLPAASSAWGGAVVVW